MSELETPRLLLRQWRDADLAPYAAMCTDVEVMRHVGGRPFTHAQAAEQMASFVRHWQERGFGPWAAEQHETGRFVGFVGLMTHDWYPGVEVGWRLARDVWGRGLATEGAAASLCYGFDTLGLERIVSIHEPANAASRRVMEKNGLTFHRETVLAHNLTLVWVYAITREEWAARRERAMGCARPAGGDGPAGRPVLSRRRRRRRRR